MKEFCDRVGGGFVLLLSSALAAAVLLLIHEGKCGTETGLAFIGASLIPMALGHQQHRRSRDMHEQLSAAKSELRMSVTAHANDVRQHVTRELSAARGELAENTRLTQQIRDKVAAKKGK